MDRQKITGWILIAWAAVYILYFLKARLLIEGPPIEKKEWVYFWMAFGGLFLGTINVRMAAARRRRLQP
ncbi:MAG: hypothetical protein JO254_07395 [Pseudolabrys sp.]|nr:hypothetical protein [Pseudolabrys sp.]